MVKESDLLEILLQYVGKPNQEQGILITGKWGAGKTHFINKTLAPAITKLCSGFKDKKDFPKRGILYISLNGVTSIDHIRQLIFYELYPRLKTDRLNYLGPLASFTSKLANKYLFDVNLNDFLSIFANMRDYVLCFDDLERMDCTIKSVLGFLNTFIEHQKAKTIITCDEDKILNASEKDIYSTYKEKLIKHTYLFVPDMPSVIDSLVAAYSDSTFASFITAHKPLFLGLPANAYPVS